MGTSCQENEKGRARSPPCERASDLPGSGKKINTFAFGIGSEIGSKKVQFLGNSSTIGKFVLNVLIEGVNRVSFASEAGRRELKARRFKEAGPPPPRALHAILVPSLRFFHG
jgi:hypothetical protein